MIAHVGPALFALFVWWASTVVIIYLDNLPPHTFKWSMGGATAVLGLALYGLHTSARDTSAAGAYAAFTWGLLAWGWQVMSFYTGVVTGPRKTPCPDGCRGWRRFLQAVETGLWHECAALAGAVAAVILTWGAPNQVGTWTFMVLWGMHESAKLNVFLGVRNLSEELFPAHLEYLKSYLRRRSMNALFPLSVTVSTVIAVVLARQALDVGASVAERAGSTFLTVLMGLAILEHWLLMLPISFDALWAPGLKARVPREAPEAGREIAGSPGAAPTRPASRPAGRRQRKLTVADDAVALVGGPAPPWRGIMPNDGAAVAFPTRHAARAAARVRACQRSNETTAGPTRSGPPVVAIDARPRHAAPDPVAAP